MTKLLADLLAEIQAREEAATPGPWTMEDGIAYSPKGDVVFALRGSRLTGHIHPLPMEQRKANGDFFVAARTDVRRLRLALEKATEPGNLSDEEMHDVARTLSGETDD